MLPRKAGRRPHRTRHPFCGEGCVLSCGAIEVRDKVVVCGADFYLAVGSSGPRENVEVLLRQLGATHPIAVAVSGSDVLHGKPHPEVFQRAAEKLKIPAGNCAVIEDAAAGITAANAAGMLSIGLVSTGHERSEYAEADHVVSHLSELSADRIGRWIDASAGV